MKLEYKIVGQRIQKCRKLKGYSQEKFAEKIDVSLVHLRFIETGRRCPSLDVLYTVALTLGISVDYLLLGAEKTYQSSVNLNFSSFLNDCRPYEQQIIMAVAREMKTILVNHRPEIENYLKQHAIARFYPY